MERRQARKALEARYREELRKLRLYWPSESVTLEQAARGALEIRLHGGGVHSFRREEVEDLLSRVPSFLWGEMLLPLLLRYEVVGSVSYYRVLGGRWQRRLAEIMLRGSYSYQGVERLRVSEFQRIIARYGSLVFVSLSV